MNMRDEASAKLNVRIVDAMLVDDEIDHLINAMVSRLRVIASEDEIYPEAFISQEEAKELLRECIKHHV